MINDINELVEYITNFGTKDAFCFLNEKDQVQHISFLQFSHEIKQCAAYINNINKNKKRLHIGILSRNCYEYQVYLLAIMLSDFVVVPLNSKKSPEEILYETEKAEIDILVHDENLDDEIRNYYLNNNLFY